MKLKNIVNKELCYVLGRVIRVAGDKVCLFREFVDKNGDSIESSWSPGESYNKIHGDSVPSLSRDFQRHQKSQWRFVRRLVSLTILASSDIIFDIASHSGPIKQSPERVIGLVKSQMTGVRGVVSVTE